MSRLLVFGATGSVGRFLLPSLAGVHEVLAVSRRPQRDTGQIRWLQADLQDTTAQFQTVDAIISLGPLDLFSEWLVRHPRVAPSRVIALSSMSASSKSDSSDSRERQLAQRLRAAEQKVQQTCAQRDVACTLFRPTLIYGAGSDRSLAPIARFARRWRFMPVPADASGLRQPVHAADLAIACVAALDNPATFDKTYSLGGGERLRFDDVIKRIRSAIPGFVGVLPIPLIALHMATRRGWLGPVRPSGINRLRTDLLADNAPATRDFGYAPRNFVPEDVVPGPGARNE